MQLFTGILHRLWKITFSLRVGLLFFLGQYQKAETLCRNAIQRSPREPLCHEWLGKAFWKQSRLAEAIQEYRVAFGLQKAVFLADRMDLIRLLLEAGHYEEVITESQKLLDPQFHKISPFFRRMHEYVAFDSLYQAYACLHDFARAKEALIKLLPFYKGQSRAKILHMIHVCEERLATTEGPPGNVSPFG